MPPFGLSPHWCGVRTAFSRTVLKQVMYTSFTMLAREQGAHSKHGMRKRREKDNFFRETAFFNPLTEKVVTFGFAFVNLPFKYLPINKWSFYPKPAWTFLQSQDDFAGSHLVKLQITFSWSFSTRTIWSKWKSHTSPVHIYIQMYGCLLLVLNGKTYVVMIFI